MRRTSRNLLRKHRCLQFPELPHKVLNVIPLLLEVVLQAFNSLGASQVDFDILVALQVPFLYNPAAGKLLLDVRHLSDDLPPLNIALDADSLQLTSSHIRGNDFAPQAGVAESLALATRFEFQVVPEPSTLTLLGFGALGLLGYRCRRTTPRATVIGPEPVPTCAGQLPPGSCPCVAPSSSAFCCLPKSRSSSSIGGT